MINNSTNRQDKLKTARLFSIIMLTLVLINVLHVGTTSAKGAWEELISFSWTDAESQTTKTIKIYKEDIQTSRWNCKSRLKLETTETKENGDYIISTTKNYITKQYSSFFNLSQTPLTLEEICKKDTKLNKNNIGFATERLYMYDRILRNTSEYLINIDEDFFEDVKKEMSEDVIGEVKAASKEVLGFHTPICDLFQDVDGATESYTNLGEKMMGWLKAITVPAAGAMNKYLYIGDVSKFTKEYGGKRSEAANDLFKAIDAIYTSSVTTVTNRNPTTNTSNNGNKTGITFIITNKNHTLCTIVVAQK